MGVSGDQGRRFFHLGLSVVSISFPGGMTRSFDSNSGNDTSSVKSSARSEIRLGIVSRLLIVTWSDGCLIPEDWTESFSM